MFSETKSSNNRTAMIQQSGSSSWNYWTAADSQAGFPVAGGLTTMTTEPTKACVNTRTVFIIFCLKNMPDKSYYLPSLFFQLAVSFILPVVITSYMVKERCVKRKSETDCKLEEGKTLKETL